MTKLIYSIDDEPTNAENFRAHPHRVEAENYLVDAYQQMIGHLSCPDHEQAAGYELRFITATGECKISTLACCPTFDAELNAALLQSISENDPDN